MLRILTLIFGCIILEYAASGQELKKDSTKESGMMRMETPDVVAKPVFEGSSGNFNLTVWIMSAITEKRNNDVKDKIDTGTGAYHVMVELKDAEKSRDVAGAIVKVLSVSPSGKKETTELESMMNQYGGNIDMNEKGDYQLNISVEADGNSTLCPVVYSVK
ncbi:MAG TPA: hypothetical protein VK213_02490 [Bacteroidales bacterium]|nr:hypothetical protein [Bacteroidales bacterium]